MRLFLTTPGGALRVRYLPLGAMASGEKRARAFEIVAVESVADATIWCDLAGALEVSINEVDWTPVPDSFISGVSLGALSAGSRLALWLRVGVVTASDRYQAVAVSLGAGV